MSIRSSMNEEDDDRSEFSEQGFKDARVEPEQRTPQVYGKDEWKETENRRDSGWSETSESGSWTSEQQTYPEPEVPKNNNIGKYILIAILVILALPVIGGFGSAVVGLAVGIFGMLLACTVGVACAGIGFSVGGCCPLCHEYYADDNLYGGRTFNDGLFSDYDRHRNSGIYADNRYF